MELRGLVLVVGVTGSGKSTTLAAMIDYRKFHKEAMERSTGQGMQTFAPALLKLYRDGTISKEMQLNMLIQKIMLVCKSV